MGRNLNWDAHRFRKRWTPIITKEMIEYYRKDAAKFAKRIEKRNRLKAERAAQAANPKQFKKNKPATKRKRKQPEKRPRPSHWLFGPV